MVYVSLTPDQLESEHICCAFSDKKCAKGYGLKRNWLAEQYSAGYRFERLNERAKVFMEYGPAEKAWQPITADECLALGCFWVSGKYAKNGHAKALLSRAIKTAHDMNRKGIVVVAGKKKFHFMGDGKWLKRQGFKPIDSLDTGFELLALPLSDSPIKASFNEGVRSGLCLNEKGITAYYSDRCPFTEFHINTSLTESCENRGLPLKIVKINSLEEAKKAPSPATIFSLFHIGQFVTTDLSVCMDKRFDKIVFR